jgi:hypothetical protein
MEKMMTTTTETKPFFKKALQRLKDDGWVKGSVHGVDSGSSATCVGGALAWAVTGYGYDFYRADDLNAASELPELPELVDVLTEFGRHIGADERYFIEEIWRWNDDDSRTEEDVLVVLEELAR